MAKDKQTWLGRLSWGWFVLGLVVWGLFLAMNAAYGLSSNPQEVMGAHGGILFVPFAAAIIVSNVLGAVMGRLASWKSAMRANFMSMFVVVFYFMIGYGYQP